MMVIARVVVILFTIHYSCVPSVASEQSSSALFTAFAQKVGSFTVGEKTFLLNGKPFVVKAAEVHYPRIPQPYWEHRIKMCKALGMNTLCIYVFWNFHEQQQDHFTFEGQADVAAFCRLAQKHGMYVIVRPGPYMGNGRTALVAAEEERHTAS